MPSTLEVLDRALKTHYAANLNNPNTTGMALISVECATDTINRYRYRIGRAKSPQARAALIRWKRRAERRREAALDWLADCKREDAKYPGVPRMQRPNALIARLMRSRAAVAR